MPASEHDLTHLLSLIEAARSHAERTGSDAQGVGRLLHEALAMVRTLQARGGVIDEGIPTEHLTTENDK
jgi:hypothetical protein